MAQIFHPSANTLSRLTLVSLAGLAVALVGGTYLVNKSPLVTRVNVVVDQPVPFSHEHHVRGLGLDCRYCHTSVETSASAGMPPTYTCMSCHSQVWTQAAILQPVRTSLDTNMPIHWQRVHDLPDFVYFDHSIHVKKGVGCESCHGRVDKMPLPWKAEPLTMEWCLKCHTNPAPNLRPQADIVAMGWTNKDPNWDPIKHYNLGQSLDRLTNCSVCHR